MRTQCKIYVLYSYFYIISSIKCFYYENVFMSIADFNIHNIIAVFFLRKAYKKFEISPYHCTFICIDVKLVNKQ